MKVGTGRVVALGSIFYEHRRLLRILPVDSSTSDNAVASAMSRADLQAYLVSEAKAGRQVSYVFTEFPSNPILVCVDLRRLRELVSHPIQVANLFAYRLSHGKVEYSIRDTEKQAA